MQSLRNKIIVIGPSHINSLGIIRSLGEFGCRVFYIDHLGKAGFSTKSRYIEKYWVADDDMSVIDILMTRFNHEQKKPILIPASDKSTSILDRHYNLLAQNFILPNIDERENTISRMMDKNALNELAKKHGFVVPDSINYRFGEIAVEQLIKSMPVNLPCIIKPLKSIDGSKADMAVCHTVGALSSTLKRLERYNDEVLIQEFVFKEGELGVQGFSTPQGEVIIPGVITKLRQAIVAKGSTTYGKLTQKHPLIDSRKIKSFIKKLGYVGIFDIEFMFRGNDVYFIEMNFRNGAYGYAFTKAGVNIPVLWSLSNSGNDISNMRLSVKGETTFINEVSDFRHVLKGKVRLATWLAQLFRADTHLLFTFSDLKPFFYRVAIK